LAEYEYGTVAFVLEYNATGCNPTVFYFAGRGRGRGRRFFSRIGEHL